MIAVIGWILTVCFCCFLLALIVAPCMKDHVANQQAQSSNDIRDPLE